ncbi:protein-L-isoaspartate O-methyltransferase family protein [Algihabitans albus]|uniref:protein-L-isoaspartate O-methyltransferase family protein n=1 Tax=Algihabitans albus TaxID=2164067 RepID=UPI000E5CDF7A|nr:protein-L-isoaspartate O-methyltransferase [Algihabitans albus]
MVDYTAARTNMVDSQLRTNRVWDQRLLAAFETLPREIFVPDKARGFAYIDEDLPIGQGRHLMEPMVFARLIQAAAIEESDMVLDLGCGLGYSTAVLARLAATVVAVEELAAFADSATASLEALEVTNAVVVQGRLTQGYAKQAPYDVILLGGAVAEVPQEIEAQLAEGGRLVGVLLDEDGLGRAMLMRKDEGVVSGRVLFDASTPVLPGFERKDGFVF